MYQIIKSCNIKEHICIIITKDQTQGPTQTSTLLLRDSSALQVFSFVLRQGLSLNHPALSHMCCSLVFVSKESGIIGTHCHTWPSYIIFLSTTFMLKCQWLNLTEVWNSKLERDTHTHTHRERDGERQTETEIEAQRYWYCPKWVASLCIGKINTVLLREKLPNF